MKLFTPMNIVLHVPICRNGSMFVVAPRAPQTLGDSFGLGPTHWRILTTRMVSDWRELR
jgi:hypothetical protein